MDNELICREYFGAVRTAADKAIGMLADPPAPNTLNRVKTEILFRQYLRDGLELRIGQGEGVGRKEAVELCEMIYSELIEDAIASIRAPKESMEIIGFLDLCSNCVTKMPIFTELLHRALGRDIGSEEATKLANEADLELEKFAAQRRVFRTSE